jgi:hypothetical protein
MVFKHLECYACLDWGMRTPVTERDEKGAVTYTTLMMHTGLASLTW